MLLLILDPGTMSIKISFGEEVLDVRSTRFLYCVCKSKKFGSMHSREISPRISIVSYISLLISSSSR